MFGKSFLIFGHYLLWYQQCYYLYYGGHMPWGPKALRNSREEFVLEKIEYFKVNVYKGRSDWTRHYFDTYREAIKFWRELYRSGKKVLIYACRNDKLGEMSTGINDRSVFKNEQSKTR